jgi:hypothetical protein
LAHWAHRAFRRYFYPALAALVNQVQNVFISSQHTISIYLSLSPQQPRQTVVQGRLSFICVRSPKIRNVDGGGATSESATAKPKVFILQFLLATLMPKIWLDVLFKGWNKILYFRITE